MNIQKLFSQHLGVVVAILAAAVPVVTAGAAELDRSPARVTQAAAGKPLTAASRATPEAIVTGYLRSNGRAPAVLSSLRTMDKSTGANRVTHLRMEQVVDGLTVQGAYVKAAINSRGELVHVIDRTVAVSNPVPSRISAGQAVRAAMAAVHPTQTALVLRPAGKKGNTSLFNGGAYFHRAPSATAVVLPMADGQSANGWLVETWTARTNQLHHTTVDGNGRVLDIESRTANDSYKIFPIDPGKGAQTVVAGPGAGNDESPVGWLGNGAQSTINIAGNNANAYLDTIENGQPDKGGTAVTTGDFLATADLTVAPTAAHNNEVSVQNLFYLNNVIHDILYRHGFDEAAGNFQIDNFGNGGEGDDPVRAEAQDGGGTDNANFATPPDGSRPRMQMFLWTGAGGTHEVVVNSPVTASYGASPAAFGPQLDTTGITGNVRRCRAGQRLYGHHLARSRWNCADRPRRLRLQPQGLERAARRSHRGDRREQPGWHGDDHHGPRGRRQQGAHRGGDDQPERWRCSEGDPVAKRHRAQTRRPAAADRLCARFRRRLPRVRPRTQLADDRPHERPPRGRHRRGQFRRYRDADQRRRRRGRVLSEQPGRNPACTLRRLPVDVWRRHRRRGPRRRRDLCRSRVADDRAVRRLVATTCSTTWSTA